MLANSALYPWYNAFLQRRMKEKQRLWGREGEGRHHPYCTHYTYTILDMGEVEAKIGIFNGVSEFGDDGSHFIWAKAEKFRLAKYSPFWWYSTGLARWVLGKRKRLTAPRLACIDSNDEQTCRTSYRGQLKIERVATKCMQTGWLCPSFLHWRTLPKLTWPKKLRRSGSRIDTTYYSQ